MSEQSTEAKFDLKVTHRDPTTGLITKKTPYTLRVIPSGDGGRQKLYERPVGSGNVFDGQDNPAGRWIVDPKTKKGSHAPEAKHVAFKLPETNDQKLARELLAKDAQLAELQKELDAIKAADEKKAGVKPAGTNSKES